MRHPSRMLLVPLALGALVLAACGSDDATSSPGTTVTTDRAAQSADDSFNDADVLFAQSMIPHHRQAVEMAELALDPAVGAQPEIIALATAIQGAQDPEIAMMTNWLEQWGQPLEMAGMEGMDDMDDMAGMDGMMSADDMANLATLDGAAFDQAWAEMMIAHHQGAIAQAETVKAAGSNADVLQLADAIIAAQQAEIDQMTALLAG